MRHKLNFTILIIVLISVVTVPAFAGEQAEAESKTYTVMDEFDAIADAQSHTEEELISYGYTLEEAKAIKEFSVENALLERAALTKSELELLGYSDYQIQLLKSYDGSEITADSEMRAVLGTVNGSFRVVSASKTSINVIFDWEWSNAPIAAGTIITDVVGCGFLAYGTDGEVDKIAPTSKSCLVKYYSGSTLVTNYGPTVEEVTPWKTVNVDFPMGKVVGGSSCWAKAGGLNIKVEEEFSGHQLDCVAFYFTYGHPGIQVSSPEITIGISSEDGITFDAESKFSYGLNPEYRRGIIVQNDGTSRQFVGDLES